MTVAQPGPSPSNRRVRRRLLGTLAALLLGIVGAELVARSAPPPYPHALVQGGVHHSVKNPEQLFVNRPDSRLVVKYADRDGAITKVVSHAINEQGFRGRPLTKERKPGSFRIACLGDSHTFGHGVGEDETWPVLLEGLLHERSNGSLEVECLNAGVDGYDPHQEVIWLRQKVLAYKPDLVLVQLHMNDAAARRQGKRDDEPGIVFRWSHPERGPGWMLGLRSASRAIDRVLTFLHASRQVFVYRESMTRLYRYESDGWVRAREALLAMRDHLRPRRIPLAVVLYPSLFHLDGNLISDESFGHWKEFLAAHDIPCLDPSQAFADKDLASLRVHPHDFHGNAQANAIFAEQIAAWLGRRGDLR